jgi:carboxyl-terminal processing protease
MPARQSPNPVDRATLAVLVAVFWLGPSPLADLSGAAPTDRQPGAWQRDADDGALQLFSEAITHIQRQAVFGGPSDRQGIVAAALRAFLAERDPYSAFLTREEYKKFTEINDPSYAGIGLEIEKRRDGSVVCYPLADGPAARAGIRAGDRLIAIDGIPARGKPLPSLVALAAGRRGTEVTVETERASGGRARFTLARTAISPPTLSTISYGAARVIRISTFTPDTRQALKFLISSWHRSDPIVIDLRSCGGGDFHAAVDAAMLFLRKGQTIVSVRGREGIRVYTSTIDRRPPSQLVFLWQDEATASAAEVFIGALTENARATSIGKTSAGKGTKQDIIELSGGAALFLTTGVMLTPEGKQFDGHGLEPMQPIAGDGAETRAYLEKVRALSAVANRKR